MARSADDTGEPREYAGGVILLTGATGNLGTALLRRLTASGERVRCLVRDPRRLGPERVRVQIALGDLAEPASFRNALRGVDTVVHLAAATRDQPIWVDDAAAAVTAALDSTDGRARYELAGPETLSYDDMARETLLALRRRRRLVHMPLPVVRSGLRALEAVAGKSSFATWEE